MPATNSVEWNFEELLIQKLSASGNYAAYNLTHANKRAKSDKADIVFEGSKGESQLAGVKGFATSCKIKIETLLSPASDQAADALCASITSDIFSEASVNYELPDVVFASIEPDSDTSIQNTKKMTIRQITVTGIIKTIS